MTILAGLDDENWMLVRNLFETLKRDFGIRFVTIDHHDFNAGANLTVLKKIVDAPGDQSTGVTEQENYSDRSLFLGWVDWVEKQVFYKPDKKDKIDKKKVVVWIDGEEPEPLIQKYE